MRYILPQETSHMKILIFSYEKFVGTKRFTPLVRIFLFLAESQLANFYHGVDALPIRVRVLFVAR
jgi:hypothetical protein